MKIKEKNYFLTLFIISIALEVLCILSFVFGFIKMSQNGDINNNIFELIYMVVHLLIVFMAIYFCLMAYKNGSSIMRQLMYMRDHDRLISKTALVISLTLSLLGLGTCIYFTLALFMESIPTFNFPIMLLLILINSPLTVFIFGLAFFLYPLIINNLQKKK